LPRLGQSPSKQAPECGRTCAVRHPQTPDRSDRRQKSGAAASMPVFPHQRLPARPTSITRRSPRRSRSPAARSGGVH
jgi:hypothetical protein